MEREINKHEHVLLSCSCLLISHSIFITFYTKIRYSLQSVWKYKSFLLVLSFCFEFGLFYQTVLPSLISTGSMISLLTTLPWS